MNNTIEKVSDFLKRDMVTYEHDGGFFRTYLYGFPMAVIGDGDTVEESLEEALSARDIVLEIFVENGMLEDDRGAVLVFEEVSSLVDDLKKLIRVTEEEEGVVMYESFLSKIERGVYNKFLEEEYSAEVYGSVSDALWAKFVVEN